MQDGPMEDSTVEDTPAANTPGAGGVGTTVGNLTIFDGLALVIALVLVGVGFLIGTAGSGTAGTTISAELTVTPDDDTRSLPPGATRSFPLYITNTNSYGAQVTSISAGTSNATRGGCAAGTVTSAPIEAPAGFIEAGHVRAYEVSVTMAANADNRCKNQSFTLPLTVSLASAAGGRHFSFGSS